MTGSASLIAELKAEAERLRRQLRFLPAGQVRTREARLADLLDRAARQLAAGEAGLVDTTRLVTA